MAHSIIRWLADLMLFVDQQDYLLLKVVPPKMKRNIVRRCLNALPGHAVGRHAAGSRLTYYSPGHKGHRRIAEYHADAVFQLMHQRIRPGMHVVDVGAHFGYFSILAAQLVGLDGRVVALEPAQDNLHVLYTNALTNNLTNIIIVPCAAAANTGTRTLYRRGKFSGGNSLYDLEESRREGESDDVSVIAVDDLTSWPADFVKIDVEGAEMEVLQGMKETLRNPALQLVVEWNPRTQARAGLPAVALPRFLLDAGFSLWALQLNSRQLHNHAGVSDALEQVLRHPLKYVDLYAVRNHWSRTTPR